MNDLIIDELICKGTDKDRQFLVDLRRNVRLQENVGIVYIYSLTEGELINYPIKKGNVVYIGQAKRNNEPTGTRFRQHISTEQDTGRDTGSNYSLTKYYWDGRPLRLRIFQIENCKEAEAALLMWHLVNFGSAPIAQGAGGITVDKANSFVIKSDIERIVEYLKI